MPEPLAWFIAMDASEAAIADARRVVANMDDGAVLAIAGSLPGDDQDRAYFARLPDLS
jgi:hypothetical protein